MRRQTYQDLDDSSHAASMIETKILLKNIVSQSRKCERFTTLDITNFYLETIMNSCEYIHIHYNYFTKDINEKYNIDIIVADYGYIYCHIKRGIQFRS